MLPSIAGMIGCAPPHPAFFLWRWSLMNYFSPDWPGIRLAWNYDSFDDFKRIESS
jgi:hypothetical protein